MLTINKKSKKKGVISFNHTGRVANTTINVRVNDEQKSFIEDNIKQIHFDSNTMHFYMMNYSPKKNTRFRKITLERAMYFSKNGKAPSNRLTGLAIIK